MAEKYTADAPEQQQYPSPTARLKQTDMPADHALQQLQEQNLSMFVSMQAMMEEMQAAHARQMQELQVNMQAQMLRLQQQMHSMEKLSTTDTSIDAIKKEAAEKKAEDQKLKDDTAKFSGLPVEKKEEAAERSRMHLVRLLPQLLPSQQRLKLKMLKSRQLLLIQKLLMSRPRKL